MKKILIVNNNLHIGGVQKALIGLLWGIRERYDITLLLFYPGGAYLDQIPPEVKVITAAGAYRYIGMTKNDTNRLKDKLGRAFYGALARICGRQYALFLMGLGQKRLDGYDVAISYLHSGGQKSFYGGCNEFVLRHVRAEKKVAFLHCDYGACGANTKKNAALYEKFDSIAACSEGCAGVFKNCLPKLADRVQVVENCHRFDRIQAMAEAAPVAFSRDRIHIVTVARLGEEKGVDRALQVIAKLQTKTPYCYHIIGDGQQEPMLRKFVKEKNLSRQVRFHGLQENPYGYMQAADLLWIPSRSEAAPMVIGEAAFLGTPILSTETSSARGMVEKTGYGWVCENSEQGMQSALQTLLETPSIIEQAKKRKMIDNRSALDAFAACVAENA